MKPTMINFPAQYVALESAEMTYVTGGTAWDVFKDAATFFYRVFYAPYAIVQFVTNFQSGAKALDNLGTSDTFFGSLSELGDVIYGFGYSGYYLGLALRQPALAQKAWNNLQSDLAAEYIH